MDHTGEATQNELNKRIMGLEKALARSNAQLRLLVDERTLFQSERIKAETALVEERNLLRTLIDSIPDYIYVKDSQSRFMICNLNTATSCGVSNSEDTVGKTDFDFFPLEQATNFFTDEQTILQTGHPLLHREEQVTDQSTAKVKWLDTIKMPLCDRSGQIIGLVGIGRDITERKRDQETLLEKQEQLETALRNLRTTQTLLVHSETMNALGQMVAGIAHEINNPLAFVNSNIHSLNNIFEELIAAYHTLEDFTHGIVPYDRAAELSELHHQMDLDFLVDDTRDLIKQTMLGLNRVRDIVAELRRFSRLDEAEFKITHLRENIESTLLISSGELRNRITVELDIDPNLAFECAPAELNQVFLNLIMNAAQAIEGNGTLFISAREEENQVIIQFRDTGNGIPENVIPRIFDPFFTTKPIGVGTGLGLAIAHKIIVDNHRGSIRVESKFGEGATFVIVLPKEIHR